MAPRLILWASSKTLISRPEATEQQITDKALMGQWIPPRAPQIIPEHNDRVQITAEHHIVDHHRVPWNTTTLFLCIDLIFISKWSINRYNWMQILVEKVAKFSGLSGSFLYKLTPLFLRVPLLDFHYQ